MPAKSDTKPEAGASPLKLLMGVAGIYGAFMYYGVLQAQVVKYQSPEGEKLEREWFIQSAEALGNVVVGLVGLLAIQGGPSPNIPYKDFVLSGTTQVLAKAMTQKAMIFGVPFFVATLVKNAKMVPVMIGAIVLSGQTYSVQKYLQVGLIVAGVVVVSVGKASKPKAANDSSNETLGLLCLGLSLICDGLTGGVQDSMTKKYKEATDGKKLKPYDLMLFTNLMMFFIATSAALGLGQFWGGVSFVLNNPVLARKVGNFVACSALGQSAIFFTLANFDPLVCTTVTTTRKIFSVLLDIFTQGHVLNETQWGGVALASAGVGAELYEKFGKSSSKAKGGV